MLHWLHDVMLHWLHDVMLLWFQFTKEHLYLARPVIRDVKNCFTEVIMRSPYFWNFKRLSLHLITFIDPPDHCHLTTDT